MEGHLTLSQKERERLVKFEEVRAGRLTVKRAAELLGISYRQARRAYRRFYEQGAAGLVHGRRGRPSNRRYGQAHRDAVLQRYRERYRGFGPTLAAEQLAQDGLAVDHETLRRWLLDSGDWKKSRRRRGHRTRRERRARFGELVQIDGSHHAWFRDDDRRYCLMNLVDDATGITLSVMEDEETTELAMKALWMWIERYGIPQALYCDKKSVYVTDREPTLEEQLAGKKPLTAFGQACAKLGIEIITAHSPQAKGRVERNHGVYQDRLVKLLALEGIAVVAGANAFLKGGFADDLNRRFARPPADPTDAHRPLPPGLDLADVFCYEQTRTVMNDWCIRHDNRFYQILEENRPLPKPKDKVVVRTRLDGTQALLYRDTPLAYAVLESPPAQKTAPPASPVAAAASPKTKPAPDHPWRRPFKPAAPESLP